MEDWDYIIVGAGSAGCVLAERLSRDPGNRVLLLEAGAGDNSPLIHMPKGMGKLLTDPKHIHIFQTQDSGARRPETWVRGKGLGGSSSINGMMYFRGQPEDYDRWAELAGPQWCWQEMRAAFQAVEDHELAGQPGAEPSLGRGGKLHISSAAPSPLGEALIKAGEQLGLTRRPEVTQTAREGVAYATCTIKNGRRQSAAQAFLRPARRRPNLRVETGVSAGSVCFEGLRAVAIRCEKAGAPVEFRARREIILSAGALVSPAILQRSGIGDAGILTNLGIQVLVDRPAVGQNLLEHRLLMMQYELLKPWSENAEYGGWHLWWNALRYMLTKRGVLASGSYQLAAFVRTGGEKTLPDSEILVAPYSLAMNAKGEVSTGEGHAIHLFGYPLRSRSAGSMTITAADPRVPATIVANYLSDPYDQQVTLRMMRYIRRWMRQPALAGLVGRETLPGPELEKDEDIIDAFRMNGLAGYHACGTARMGKDAEAVLDGDLRVRGVDGLRVVDGSIMPSMVSANTNGPIIATAWRAADLILGVANK